MSIAQKQPFIEKIISALSTEQIATLSSLVNGSDTTPEWVYLPLHYPKTITSANIGVNYVSMLLDELKNTIVVGYLLYPNNNNCALIGVSGSSNHLSLFSIDPVNHKYEPINESLTVEELRRIIDDGAEHLGDEWVEKMRTVVNTSLGNVHFTNTNGFTELNHLKVNELTFQDTPEGETPNIKIVNADLKVGAAGETRKIYLNGVELGGGGTQLYKHTITNSDNSVKLVYYSEEQVLVSFSNFYITDLMSAFNTKNAILVEGKYAPLGTQPKKILFASIELQQPIVYAINSSLQTSDIFSDLSIMTFNDEVVAL